MVPVTYGLSRPDVAALFPGYSNDPNPGGAIYLDTSTLANGSHQISWLVTDDCGRQDGVGSRNFIVLNAAPPPDANVTPPADPATVAAASVLNSSTDAIEVSRNGVAWQTVSPTASGVRVIQVNQGARIEVRLPAGETYAGYEVADDRLRALPIGSSLDATAGVFYWQPGAGFLGGYDLLFAPSTGAGSVRVRVVVGPPMRMAVDVPQSGTTVEEPFVVAGWAIDLAAADGTGVDTVHVWARPVTGGAPVFLGVAAYGGVRPDVGALYGAQFERSSYGLTAASLEPGTYDIVVYVRRSATGSFDAAQEVRVEVR
jgi:hypothetical protein